MPTFEYKVKDSKGNTRTGTVEAADERQVAVMIREAGGLPMEIWPVRGKTLRGPGIRGWLIDPIWTGVNIKQLALFYRQLTTLLGSGMSLSEALDSVGSRMYGRFYKIITQASAHVRDGGRLSDVMCLYPRVFNRMQISLIRAGESGGLLESMTGRVASYLEYEISIRTQISKIVFYPFAIFFFIVITPHVPALFLSGFNAFYESLWGSVRVWLPWIAIGFVALKFLLQIEAFRMVWDVIKIQPPVLGMMAHKIAISRFCRAISSLYVAGMSMAEAVDISADACANVFIGNSIKRAIPSIQRGNKLTESLASTRVVMPIVLDMLSTGEKTGDMDVVLTKVADYMDDEVDMTIHKSGIVLFIILILVAAWIVLQMSVGAYSDFMKNTTKESSVR
ncbi:MAG: type II secretion system F family protein [Armatimonadota bacterium]|nr:type II secretion system F family protein [bacterium]